MESSPIDTAFFVAGGTVPPDSPSYVERRADREILDALLAGEFCFVLNSRQMGKSSLAVRTIARLAEEGVRTAFVDLTRLGATGADPERWYAGLLVEIGRALGLRSEAMAYLKTNAALPAVARLFGFLRDVALVDGGRPFVLMVDEIDAVRSLPFPADDLFAGLRELHNARATDPAVRRLTVCLLGAALPSDLIADPRRTPFNVGRRIELRDFTPEEACPFGGVVGEVALAKVLGWTGGHPFLTQALCADLSGSAGAEVDALVRSRYLDARARETDTNLADVGNRLLGAGDPDVTDEDRAATLTLYERILKGKDVPDDESNSSAARIKMSGVARVEDGRLRLRNRIYREAFGARWVRESMPGGELRRQRKAFYKGVIRTGLASTFIVALVSTLALAAYFNAVNARRERDRANEQTLVAKDAQREAEMQKAAARYDAYVASMQTMAQRDAEGDFAGVRRTLSGLRDDPAQGWEWAYWNRAVDHGAIRLDWKGATVCRDAASARSPFIPVTDFDSLTIYEAATGRRLRRVPLGHSAGQPWQPNIFRDGRRVLVTSGLGDRLLVVDLATGQVLRRRDFTPSLTAPLFSPDNWDSENDRFTIVGSEGSLAGSPPRISRLDLDTLRTSPLPGLRFRGTNDITLIVFGDAGRKMAGTEGDGRERFVVIRRAEDLREIRRIPISVAETLRAFSPLGSEFVIDDGRSFVRRDATTGRPLGSFPSSGAYSFALYSPDGYRLLVSNPKICFEYDLTAARPRLMRTIPGVNQAFYLPQGRLFLDADPDLLLLSPAEAPVPSERRLPGSPFVADNLSVGQGADGQVSLIGAGVVVSVARERPLDPPSRRRGVPSMIDASGRFAFWSGKGRSRVSDLAQKRPTLLLPNTQASWVGQFAASPDGGRIVYSRDATSLGVYDASNGGLLQSLGLGSPSACARFSDDGRWLASGDLEGNVDVWDAKTWKRVAGARLGGDMILALAFSDDGMRLAAAGVAGGLGVLDLRNGSSTRLPAAHVNVRALAWSHDGRRIATATDDRKVRLWEPTKGRELGAIGAHEALIAAVWFTSGDRTLCSLDTTGALKLWPTGDRL